MVCAPRVKFLVAITLVSLVFPSNRAAGVDAAKPAELAPELRVADNLMVAIPKNGFGKDYLFTASLIPQEQWAIRNLIAYKRGTPMWKT